ncbi:CAP domain-containing protein [Geminocystis sp. GBBB08]|uniref:CAP domain-containing protein n=1 Tax=Geminocystis sp. GBBB08 TaxID=2604140 RepID=UPI0027E32020|nr:CAP domain-containing protein [Geminocystis sp. GBBB08]MBL1209411.1 CAP domain-containing protein [Geminocystis sp. GBBB08]
MEEHPFIIKVVYLTNQFRIANGISPLSIDLNLQKATQQHSENMGNLDFFSHTGIDNRTYLFVGENEKNNILANFPQFQLEGVAFEVII